MEAPLLIDVSRLVGRAGRGKLPTGIDRVCLQWIARFGPRSQAVLQRPGWRRIVSFRTSQQLFELLHAPGRHFARQFWGIIARASIPPWPSQSGNGRVYLNAGQSGLDDPGATRWIAARGMKPVFMVHDLIPLTHPECCRRGERERHLARLVNMMKLGTAIVTNSEDTLVQLAGFAREQGMPLPASVAAPLGFVSNVTGEAIGPRPRPEPYFVVLGTIEPRKNHMLLLRLWRQLVSALGPHAPHLHIIGQRGWDWEPVLAMLDTDPAAREFVHELGPCSDTEVMRHLRHAQALLFPSLAEGFGLPLVEALSVGTPVLASDLPVFHEIANDVPEYFSPADDSAWLQALLDYTQESSARRALQVARLANFAPPGWELHFQRMESLLETLR